MAKTGLLPRSSTRVLALLRARLASGPQGGLPVAAWLAQGVIIGVFCALVRDHLPPFAYGVFALSLSAAFLALPLLGELGWLLRRDEAEAWIEAQPVRRHELELARLAHLLILLGGLVLGGLVPAAVFAPSDTELWGRFALPLLGLGQAVLLAAILLGVQSSLGERAEGLLVALQTLLVIGVVVGLVLGLRWIPSLARLPTLGDEHAAFLWLLPPAWFAAPLAAAEGEAARLWLPAFVTVLALVVLALIPPPARERRASGSSWLTLLFSPVRRLAQRWWVRSDERGPFDLVYDALPREREVVLRTVPMLGIPLAFLVVASTEEGVAGARADLLALLLFTVGVYLPILLTHVPGTSSPRAAWLTGTAPVPEGAIRSGAIKALAVRFLVPLFALLSFIAWTQAGALWTLRLAPPALIVALLVLRSLYPVCVSDPPLSVAPSDLRFELDWMGVLGGLSLVLTLLAVLAQRFVNGPVLGLGLLGAVLACEVLADRRLRRSFG